MEEQLFEDYKSKYLDLHDKVKHNRQKVSILEYFELELIHRDEINVNYIIQLLIKLKSNIKTEQTEKEIYNLLNTEATLRSKRELIEQFISENLLKIKDKDDIPQEFDKFWNEEQQKAFKILVKDENLSEEKPQRLIENYLFAEKKPLRDEILELIEGKKPSALQRKRLGEQILNRILGFIDTFIDGMAIYRNS